MIPFRPLTNRWLHGLAEAAVDPAWGDVLFSQNTEPDDVIRLLAALERVCDQVNNEYFRFELTSIGEAEEPLVEEFNGPADKQLASGLQPGHFDRKLVLVLPLEQQGNPKLQLTGAEKSAALTAGTVCAFPAFLSARVQLDPGESIRLAIVHALGPSFR